MSADFVAESIKLKREISLALSVSCFMDKFSLLDKIAEIVSKYSSSHSIVEKLKDIAVYGANLMRKEEIIQRAFAIIREE